MRTLIALTVFMGILIVVGLAVVIGTIVHRVAAPKPALSPAGAAAPGHAALALPPGARLGAMTAVGDRLVLQITTEDSRSSLITLDPMTGTVLETIDFVSQPSAVSP
jgi:Family of unknown function (DUF6476)